MAVKKSHLPDTFADTFAPKWAVLAWVDETHVFAAIPSKEGPPYIMKESRTDGGLGKLLGTMSKLYVKEKPTGRNYRPKQRSITRVEGPKYSEGVRLRTREILKRKGMI